MPSRLCTSPALCVLALALTWVVAALVPATHVKDAVALYDFTLLGGPRVDDLANALLALLDPLLYTLWGIAARHRRARGVDVRGSRSPSRSCWVWRP